ncbi:MAG: hypothetical protein US94_C0028G0002 [Berkelbacteria bacterium GW2011_GWB1_38_5]|uniref:General secretion pathway GspH domain-containing protein n=2 Tax=Candidatus Berkelbacteria TaxID=1618330 RepID=A0A0G0PLU1_9BACT|nr:MAG: hypothetical protein US94_C0028G0002 [Berkelbacteria bacterium GW2011_GWB1_38_5]KKQ90291.1 MAG: hypothetical protein UT15_C0016G0003 [Berkelbacteria bacterium GW2011_GWA1_39_10]
MKKAVSFIELVVVISIMGLIAVITIPTVKSYLPSWQLSGTARVLLNQLRQAQEEAVTAQKQHLVRFTSTASPVTYDLIKVDGTETVVETTTMPNNIIVALDASITGNQIIFSSDGGPSSSGNITISLNGVSKIINITPAGVMKLQ